MSSPATRGQLFKRCVELVEAASTKAQTPVTRTAPTRNQVAHVSATPTYRMLRAVHALDKDHENGRSKLEEYSKLLEAVAEKRRLTIEWRGAAFTQSELIQRTANRVGLAAPELAGTST